MPLQEGAREGLRDESSAHAEDQRDVRAVRSGDVEAFGRIVERHAIDLRRTLARFVRDTADVDDLLQECLVRAFAALDRYDATRAMGPWLRRIAVNLALDELKRRTRREEIADPEPVLDAVADPVTSDRDVESRELEAALEEELDALPADWAAVFRLRALEEMTYAEIAETLDVPMGTVMSRLARARARLAQAFTHRFGSTVSEETP